MSIKTFYALPPLIGYANGLLDAVDTVSLDIFDTLFVRRIYDPDMVKFPVCDFIVDHADRLGIRCTRRDVWRMRYKIEKEHRQRHGRIYPDHEARYDDFMQEALENLFGDKLPPDFLKIVADFEMRLEGAMIVPRQALTDWIQQLHEKRKRILLISDIYLPAKYLQRLVAEKGLEAFVDGVISSADTFKAKASGAAWPMIQQDHELDKSRWLHVGDNPISDGLRPSEFGIKALVIKDAREKQRKNIARRVHMFTAEGGFWRGRDVQQLMLPLEAENQPRDQLYNDGYHFFGYLMGYFIHSLADRCKEENIKRIYFCSREGWTFQRCWERSLGYYFASEASPDVSYLYVSRMALAKAACAENGLTPQNSSVAMLPPGNRDFRDICRIFNLDIEPFRKYLHSHDLQDDSPIGPLTPGATPAIRVKYNYLLQDVEFQAEVKRQAKPARDLFTRYLEQEGFFDYEDVAVVDIGWLGTIQHYLTSAISHRDDAPKIHGLLFGATRVIPYKANFQNFHQYIRGILLDQYHFDFASTLIANAKDVFEESFRGPHPTLMAYEEEDGRVVPRLRDTSDAAAQAEAEQDKYYQPLRQGIFDAAERYAAAITVLGYFSGEVRPWVNFLLLTKLGFPHASEVERIRHRSHQDDFAGKHKVPKKILRQTRTLWDYPTSALRYNPFLRLRQYLRNGFDALRVRL